MKLELIKIVDAYALTETDGAFRLEVRGADGVYQWRIFKQTRSAAIECGGRAGYKRSQDAVRVGRWHLQRWARGERR